MENSASFLERVPTRELSVPYVTAIRQEAKGKIPGHEGTIDIVFN